jgi:hypothetical protein
MVLSHCKSPCRMRIEIDKCLRKIIFSMFGCRVESLQISRFYYNRCMFYNHWVHIRQIFARNYVEDIQNVTTINYSNVTSTRIVPKSTFSLNPSYPTLHSQQRGFSSSKIFPAVEIPFSSEKISMQNTSSCLYFSYSISCILSKRYMTLNDHRHRLFAQYFIKTKELIPIIVKLKCLLTDYVSIITQLQT